MFVIISLFLGALAGHFLPGIAFIGVICIFLLAYFVLHKMDISGQIVAGATWFMLYFLVAMLLSGLVTALVR